MTRNYSIKGMTCNGCLKKVIGALENIREVEEVQIDLESGNSQIEMDHHISISDLQNVLSKVGSYSISEQKNEKIEEQTSSNWKRLFPLFLVFTYLLGLVVLTQLIHGWEFMKAMQNFMGGFFIAFSFFKFLDLKGFAYSFSSYDPIAKRWLGYGYIYPFIELVFGLAYLSGITPLLTNVATLIIITIGTIGVAQALLKKNKIQCACLGTIFNLPMTQVTLTENSLMIVMALVMLGNFI